MKKEGSYNVVDDANQALEILFFQKCEGMRNENNSLSKKMVKKQSISVLPPKNENNVGKQIYPNLKLLLLCAWPILLADSADEMSKWHLKHVLVVENIPTHTDRLDVVRL